MLNFPGTSEELVWIS